MGKGGGSWIGDIGGCVLFLEDFLEKMYRWHGRFLGSEREREERKRERKENFNSR